jgi:hypothetical protein
MRCFYSIMKITIGLLLMIFLVSCKKEIVNIGTEGELNGAVNLYISNNNYSLHGSGVKVTIDGSSPLFQTTTDENGQFVIKELPTGIYDLVFTKDSFVTNKIVSYQFVGGEIASTVGQIGLYKLNYSKITDLTVNSTIDPNYWVSVKGKISQPIIFGFRYYLSMDSNVSYSNYQATGETEYNLDGEVWINLYNDDLLNIPANTTIYLIIYPCSAFYASYFDINTGKEIYMVNTQLPSGIVSFVSPNVTLTPK